MSQAIQPPARRTTVRGGALLAAAALVLSSCGGDGGDPAAQEPAGPQRSPSLTSTPAGTPSVESSDGPSAEPSPRGKTGRRSGAPDRGKIGSPGRGTTSGSMVNVRATDVYYVVRTAAGPRLARERHRLAGVDPVAEAVEQMIAGADDPDYRTMWDPRTRVRGIKDEGGLVTVDLSREALRSEVGRRVGVLMKQQLVHTVTEVLGRRARVRLLVEGAPARRVWAGVSWRRPARRAEALGVRLLVQLDEPRERSTSGSPVVVKGEAAVFEGTVQWRLIGDDGVVKKGFTTTAEAMRFTPFLFRIAAPPGSYTLVVSEDDVSGGEGRPPMRDTRTIRVR